MQIAAISSVAAISAALLLSACGRDGRDVPKSDPAANTSAPAPTDSAFTTQSVWNGSLDACRNDAQTAPVDQCMVEAIRSSGAAPQAIAAARWLVASGNPGYVSAWRQDGNVGIATITYPFRANTNEGTFLIPVGGEPIDVDANPIKGMEGDERLKQFAKAHPDSMPFAPATPGKAETNSDGQRLIFATPMKSCHACAVDGMLEIAYDFDSHGAARGSSLLSIR